MSTPASPTTAGAGASTWQEAAELLWLAALVTAHAMDEEGFPASRSPSSQPPSPAADPVRATGDTAGPSPTAAADMPFGAVTSPSPPGPSIGGSDPGESGRLLVTGPRRRDLPRAMRAFRALVDSPFGEPELDEEATADQAAYDDLWLPVVRPPRERRLSLDIVIDDSRFALLQRETAETFAAAFEDVAAFRLIHRHLLDTDRADTNALRLRTGPHDRTGRPATVLSAPGGNGRRLIVVLTDGVGDAWHNGAAHRLLAHWGGHSAVCVVHLLPARLWERTGITPVRVELRAPGVAAATGDYHASPPSGTVPTPVIGTTRAQVTMWAGFVMGRLARWRAAVVPCPSDEDERPEPDDQRTDLSAEERVRVFRLRASSNAFELAVHLASVPLVSSVMRLVQRRLVPEATEADLAELLGSGLIRRVNASAGPFDIPYDFLDGVREELLRAGRRSDTAQVLLTAFEHLGPEMSELRVLYEVVVSPSGTRVPDLPPDLEPIVRPVASALEAMAGPYSAPARSLRAALHPEGPKNSGHAISSEQEGHVPAAYPHLVKEPQPHDPFGVTINMSSVKSAPARQANQPPPVWNVPQKNPNFTGRETVLNRLHERLSAGTTAVLPEALHGLGGVGKSQIAIEYCYIHQQDYDLIWWIPAERLTMVRQAFVDLAVHLDLNVTDPNVAVPAVREALRLGRPYGNWLLVFDNAEDVDEVRKFFPPNGPGKIMVTSRSRDWFDHATPLEVDVFTREESRELLRRRRPELTEADADAIAERLGDLPLAIEQAAVWLAETGMPVSEYLQLFDAERNELLHVEGAEVPVAAAWNVSFARLQESHPAALQLLRVCAFLAPEPIPRTLLASSRDLEGPAELLEALRDPIALGRAMRAINQYALAKMDYRNNTIALHRLVQRVVTSQLPEREASLLRHCGHLLLANADPQQPGNRTRWPEYQALFPHVIASRLEECPDPWARQLLLNLIDYLYLWGDNKGFLHLARRVVEAWGGSLGAEHDLTLAAELRLGRALRLRAEFEAAYRHHLHARDALLERLGPEHERTLEAQGYLGADLRYLGRFGEALEIDRKAYEALSRLFGPDDLLTLEQAHLLAIDYRLTGDPWRARDLDEETLRRKEEVMGSDALTTLSSRAALAIDEMECGRYQTAFELQKFHTGEMRRRYGNSHPGTMEGIALLSVMSRKAGHHEDALELSKEAISLFLARYGEKFQVTVAVSMNHAINLRHVGRIAESVELGRRARELYEEIFGPEHPNTPTADVNIAVSLRLAGQAEEARKLDQAALETLTRVLGPDHPRTLVCAINLASDLFALERYDEALERDRQTLERIRRVLRHDHPNTLTCAFNLSLDLRATGGTQEADELLASTLAGYRRTFGEGHPGFLDAVKGNRANCDIYPIGL
ncbi:FxSxx-COOH system tetratricopeptide repeat protein [Streptosporangium longisporum]|uniref:FxSxx-COOH system tetratricopeptide repeat protein n=1 Tax=Streptosporangium longisporum TaxID=46187 RepID=A0ABN3Y510_9ACTN